MTLKKICQKNEKQAGEAEQLSAVRRIPGMHKQRQIIDRALCREACQLLVYPDLKKGKHYYISSYQSSRLFLQTLHAAACVHFDALVGKNNGHFTKPECCKLSGKKYKQYFPLIGPNGYKRLTDTWQKPDSCLSVFFSLCEWKWCGWWFDISVLWPSLLSRLFSFVLHFYSSLPW